jgi:3-phenylpropionate/trans-cinnamate dioxygenase ferredoxin reductase subunit
MSEAMVIVGAGHAGASAAESLRKAGWQERIVVVSDEPIPSYERPTVSKAMLFGETTGSIRHRWPDGPATYELELHLHTAVVAVNRQAKRVELSDGTMVSYRKLLIATGAAPRRLAAADAATDGVHYLRTAADAARLRPMLDGAGPVVVVGGGLIGLEVAAGMAQLGIDVTVLEASPGLLSRAVPRALATAVLALHRARGVSVRLDAVVATIAGDAGALTVTLAGGDHLRCTAVIVAIGAEPRLEVAGMAGLRLDDGVSVDEHLVSSDPDILAAGDVCRFPHPLFGGRQLRLESWQNAEAQGSHAGRIMMGHREPYAAVPWFWSDQFDQVLHVAGLADAAVRHVPNETVAGDVVVHGLDRNGVLVSVAALGAPGRVGRVISMGRRLVGSGAAPDPARLAGGEFG